MSHLETTPIHPEGGDLGPRLCGETLSLACGVPPGGPSRWFVGAAGKAALLPVLPRARFWDGETLGSAVLRQVFIYFLL